MTPHPPSALNDGVRKREVFGWAMYDFANSGYTTVVLTAVFNSYFVGVVTGGAVWGTFAWTLALAVSSALVMALMPALGAYADRHAAKKRLLAMVTIGCVLCTAALGAAGPGDLALAVLAVVLSNVCYSIGESLCAAFLPEIARPDSLGRVSGWGWSFGYLGGMLTLGLSLAWVLQAQGQGQTATQFVPVTMWITAAVFAVASLPLFALLRERGDANAAAAAHTPAASPWQRVVAAWRASAGYVDFRHLLACTVAYQAGIAVVIALAAVYAAEALGFTQTDTMMLVFLVNIAAALGALAWGHVQDRIGHRPALGVTLAGWIVMTVLAVLATTKPLFWAAAVVAGLCMGSSQSAGRALVGVFAPAGRQGEFFGLWTYATRAAAIIGPVTYGAITWVSGGNHRMAILSTGLFFVLGLVLLQRVNVARGATAKAASAG